MSNRDCNPGLSDPKYLEPQRAATGNGKAGDVGALRTALSQFTTGVAVVTTAGPEKELVGVTISSFNSVSLDPPLILFSIDRRAYSLPAFQNARGFAVNILAHDQEVLSNQFAQALGEKWRDVRYRTGRTGAPLLAGALAYFDCVPYAVYDGGDHLIFVGNVIDLGYRQEGEPLVFFRSQYVSIDVTSKRDADWPLSTEWPLPIHY